MPRKKVPGTVGVPTPTAGYSGAFARARKPAAAAASAQRRKIKAAVRAGTMSRATGARKLGKRGY